MAYDLLSRYVWIIDTINRYGRITRSHLSDLWRDSSLSDGNPLPERTFFHYRRAIEKIFNIEISCNRRGEFSIEMPGKPSDRKFINWMLDSYAVNGALKDASLQSDLVMLEEVPSARENLPVVMDALKERRRVTFTYAGFSRSRPEAGIIFAPYFVRLYKQRWYMVGAKEGVEGLRTYALDRVREINLRSDRYEIPAGISPEAFFENVVGITTSHADTKTVKIRTDNIQAKYFRALPLHSSQTEEIHDNYSIFTYRLKLNYELVHELLGFGAAVKVTEPPELKAMIRDEIQKMNEYYL